MNSTTLAEVIRKAIEFRLIDVRVAMPARIESYDRTEQTVDVQPLVKNVFSADGGTVTESLPVIPCVPVCFPRGGDFFISLPLTKGDTGLVVICDRSIDQWWALGQEADPQDMRTHGLHGAVFYPGLWDSARALSDVHASNIVIGKDGGAQIHVKSAEIHLGQENASEFVALATKVGNELTSIINAFNAHTHPAPGGATSAPLTPITPAGSVAASKVKAT